MRLLQNAAQAGEKASLPPGPFGEAEESGGAGVVFRSGLGGAICGSLLGVVAGSVCGTIGGAVCGDLSLGLDGALLGGLIVAVLGAIYGGVVGRTAWPARSASQEPQPPVDAECGG